MTFSKCLSALVVFELVLASVVALAATLVEADVTRAVMAWAACAVGAILAHVFSWYPQGKEFLVARLGAATMCRTLFPLAFVVWGLKFAGPRIETSVGLILLSSYLAGLVADSVLNLKRNDQQLSA